MTQASSQPNPTDPVPPAAADPLATPTTPAIPATLVARAGTTYRRYRYVMFVLMLCFSGWFLYDGFKRWPAEKLRYEEISAKIDKLSEQRETNRTQIADLEEVRKKMKNRRDFDIRLQQMLGFGLIPVAIGLMVFWLKRSGGEFRLEGGILHLPGHPPVPLDTITTLDKTKWDRKGIAFAEYHLPSGQSGRFRLDDFIYDAHPIRDIVKQIEASILQRAAALGVLKTPPAP